MPLSEQVKKGKFQNWIRATLGLRYLKEGLATFISQEADEQYKNYVQYVLSLTKRSEYDCTNCTPENLLPNHGVENKKCNQTGIDNCFCAKRFRKNRRMCPQASACGILYDAIIDEHTHKAPSWHNTNIEKWSSSSFEFFKCFISTPGYKTKSSFAQLDALALLSICQNNRKLKANFNDIKDKIEKVRTFYTNMVLFDTYAINMYVSFFHIN